MGSRVNLRALGSLELKNDCDFRRNAMNEWIQNFRAALSDFDRPGRSLDAALRASGASPAELGQALRAVVGTPEPGQRPPEPHEAAARWADLLQALARDMRESLPTMIYEFESRIVSSLRGNRGAQAEAGLLLSCEFSVFGWSQEGLLLADPAGTTCEGLFTDRFNSGRSWICLGWPRNGRPRPVVRIEDAIGYTRRLEGERLAALAEFQAEEQRREAVYQAQQAQSTDGRIRALEAEIARLRSS